MAGIVFRDIEKLKSEEFGEQNTHGIWNAVEPWSGAEAREFNFGGVCRLVMGPVGFHSSAVGPGERF